MSVLEVAHDPVTVIVAVDPGKVSNRVWISNGSGLLTDPMSLPISREGIAQLELALNKHGPSAPALSSRKAQRRTVTALVAMPLDGAT